jgi:hypothetical protein
MSGLSAGSKRNVEPPRIYRQLRMHSRGWSLMTLPIVWRQSMLERTAQSNPAAFSSFQQLPPDLAEQVLIEFIALLESKFCEQAADIFIGPALPERELIVPRLASIAESDRQLFLDGLVRRGYDENVPGIARGDSRTFDRYYDNERARRSPVIPKLGHAD